MHRRALVKSSWRILVSGMLLAACGGEPGQDLPPSEFSNAVRLDYYVDGVLRSSDERPGSSGSWDSLGMAMAHGQIQTD